MNILNIEYIRLISNFFFHNNNHTVVYVDDEIIEFNESYFLVKFKFWRNDVSYIPTLI